MLNFIASPKKAEVAKADDPSISRTEEEILAAGRSCEEVLHDLQALAMNALLVWRIQGSRFGDMARFAVGEEMNLRLRHDTFWDLVLVSASGVTPMPEPQGPLQ